MVQRVLRLEVRATSAPAIALYQRFGFVRSGVRKAYYENGIDAVLMDLNLIEEGLDAVQGDDSFQCRGLARLLADAHDRAAGDSAGCQPGQFVMVRVNRAIDPLLRRPFGIFDVAIHTPAHSGAVAQPYLEMLYRVVGKGTAMLSALHETDLLDILGPLGSGFDLGPAGEEKLIVGGGVGLAPLYLLARELVKQSPVRLFAGGRTGTTSSASPNSSVWGWSATPPPRTARWENAVW